MYYFSIPDSGFMRILNDVLFTTLSQHREWFYDDFKIDTVYGCPPRCIWNGGRIVDSARELNEEELQYIFFSYGRYGVTYRLNFTNLCLLEEDLRDDYCNLIAKVANENKAKVAVTLPIVAEYLKINYPNLKISWSTSTIFGDNLQEMVQKINEVSKNAMVVLPYNLNNEQEITKLVHPENLEVLVCDSCMDDCPRRGLHHKLISQAIRQRDFNSAYNDCIVKKELQNETLNLEQRTDKECIIERNYKNIICRNMLRLYDKIGINKFKISDRTSISMTMASYIHFFVQPQYREQVVNE